MPSHHDDGIDYEHFADGTPDDDQTAMDAVAKEWLEARRIIQNFLQELQPGMPVLDLEHNAAAIIARLSHAGFAITKVC